MTTLMAHRPGEFVRIGPLVMVVIRKTGPRTYELAHYPLSFWGNIRLLWNRIRFTFGGYREQT